MRVFENFKNIKPLQALLMRLMYDYQQMRYALNGLEIQKICYFLKEVGETSLTNLKFEKNQYGPYAEDLKKVLQYLIEQKYIIKNDNESDESDYGVTDDANQKASAYLENGHDDALNNCDKVSRLIAGYEYPLGMELLSTVHWVVKHDKVNPKSFDAVIRGVWNWCANEPSWNNRKQQLMPKDNILSALKTLSENKFIDYK